VNELEARVARLERGFQIATGLYLSAFDDADQAEARAKQEAEDQAAQEKEAAAKAAEAEKQAAADEKAAIEAAEAAEKQAAADRKAAAKGA
jgi:colicin import membrane protein